MSGRVNWNRRDELTLICRSSSLAKYSRLYSDRLEEDRVGRGAIRRNSSHKRRWSIKSSGGLICLKILSFVIVWFYGAK